MDRWLTSYYRNLLPLYASGRLGALQHRLVEGWLKRSPSARQDLARIRLIRQAVSGSGMAAPSPAVLAQISATVRRPTASPALRPGAWVIGMLLGVLLGLLAWFALPPVNVLAWSVDGLPPAGFRVYRGAVSDPAADFRLISEIPAGQSDNYRFVDFWFQPGRDYIYRVEAIDAQGSVLTSDIVTGNNLLALPGQIALLGSALICLYGVAVYLQAHRRQTLTHGLSSIY